MKLYRVDIRYGTHTIGRQWPQAEESPVWGRNLYCKPKTVQTRVIIWVRMRPYSRLWRSSRNSNIILDRNAYCVAAKWFKLPVPVGVGTGSEFDTLPFLVPVRRILDNIFENRWEWFVDWPVAGCGLKVTCSLQPCDIEEPVLLPFHMDSKKLHKINGTLRGVSCLSCHVSVLEA